MNTNVHFYHLMKTGGRSLIQSFISDASDITDIDELKDLFDNDLKQVNNAITLDSVKIKYLGRKGEISKLFKKLGELRAEEKKETGKLINDLKNYINAILTDHHSRIAEKTEKDKIMLYLN